MEKGEKAFSPIGRNNEPENVLTVVEAKKWLNDKGVPVTMKMVQDYKDYTHTTEMRLAYDEWMQNLECRVDGQVTALTDDDDDVHVDLGDSAQLLFNGLKKNATTAHTFTEVIRGFTRSGELVENDQDHWRGPGSKWGPKEGLPMTYPAYAKRMISETVGGEKIGNGCNNSHCF